MSRLQGRLVWQPSPSGDEEAITGASWEHPYSQQRFAMKWGAVRSYLEFPNRLIGVDELLGSPKGVFPAKVSR